MTPGRCDLAPAAVRRALRRFSTFDLNAGLELDLAVHDAGDVPVQGLMPADGFLPIRDAVEACVRDHRAHPPARRQQCGDSPRRAWPRPAA